MYVFVSIDYCYNCYLYFLSKPTAPLHDNFDDIFLQFVMKSTTKVIVTKN